MSHLRPARCHGHHGRPIFLDLAPALLIAGMAAATMVTAPDAAAPPRAAQPQAGAFAWSPGQVRALMAEIRASRRHGLDPAAYGLAALGAELELCEQLWNTPGSRQLDMLARSAALALAGDYRRAAGSPAPVRAADLDAALGARRIGAWLAGLAPAGGKAS